MSWSMDTPDALRVQPWIGPVRELALRPGKGPPTGAVRMSQAESTGPGPKLLEQRRTALRSRHYSRRTEKACVMWARRFVRFHDLRHPAQLAEPEINAFLTHLAVEGHVSASTQNQALSALLFLYRHVLDREIGQLVDVIRARKPGRLPIVMTCDEIRAIIRHLSGEPLLMALLSSM